jgi:hypothetical protein
METFLGGLGASGREKEGVHMTNLLYMLVWNPLIYFKKWGREDKKVIEGVNLIEVVTRMYEISQWTPFISILIYANKNWK